ncbi:MAG TPA: YceI family protein [Parapedobacter sp.]|uniref:YceI family protein n=1 Tax=Parapedobacter sp. TaxID=1958893 RepID=UPI002C8AD037|nr:YceI family protein [Parapedobacter sp.]HWK59070.1 YceI family protein [Parapedobacter sp.]
MKKKILYSGMVCLLLLSAFTSAYFVGWQVKEGDYAVKFSTKGASGTLKGLKGTIEFNRLDLANSKFDVTVDVNTISTGLGLKNRHAKAADFLDAEKYPTIRFASHTVTPTENGFVANGNLTIKDVTREIAIPFTFDGSGDEGVFRGRFELKRTDYHLEKKRIGEVIAVELVVPVSKQP